MKKRILIAEDEVGYQELHEALLKKEFDLSICDSIEEALVLIAQQPFDLVISDIMFPGMNGLEFLSRVHLPGPNQDIPVVLCSGVADDGMRAKAMELGAVGFIPKPLHPEVVLTTARLLTR